MESRRASRNRITSVGDGRLRDGERWCEVDVWCQQKYGLDSDPSRIAKCLFTCYLQNFFCTQRPVLCTQRSALVLLDVLLLDRHSRISPTALNLPSAPTRTPMAARRYAVRITLPAAMWPLSQRKFSTSSHPPNRIFPPLKRTAEFDDLLLMSTSQNVPLIANFSASYIPSSS